MPKPGYKVLTLKEGTMNQLQSKAAERGITVSQYLERFLGLSPGITEDCPRGTNASKKRFLGEASLSSDKEGSMVGRTGFEPVTTAVSGQYPNQTRRPAHA